MASASASQTGSALFCLLRDPTAPDAWRSFVDLYGPKVYAWCRRWGLQDADAEDVTGDVLAKLAVTMRTFAYDPAKGGFRRWLKTVTHHALADFIKHERRYAGIGGTDAADFLENLEAREDFERSLAEAFDPELLAQAKVHAQLRVSREAWDVFIALAVDKRPGREIATQLRMTLSAVYEARSRVQSILKEEIQRLKRDE
jgi:RNA polymerase sigma factor (sigma-70 family)